MFVIYIYIPVASKRRYKLKLTEKVENVLKRMRWKAHLFDGEAKKTNSSQNSHQRNKKNFQFKSRNCPKQIEEMKVFEADLADMIKDIKFQTVNNRFQQQLRADVHRIQNSNKTFIPADKTQNYYEVSKEDHEKILQENVTKTYQKSSRDLPHKINTEARKIAEKYKVDGNLDQICEQQCFVTIKDHKEDFRINPKYRLINPTKSEMGRMSKIILDKLNNQLREATNCNQWKNSKAVIDWFNAITHKSNCTFVMFDIEEFYPSISEKLLKDSLIFAQRYSNMSNQDKEVIFHCRKSLLFHNNDPWIKNKGNKEFDVAMGSHDGAEICELVGIFILSLIAQKYRKEDTGLYRDDGLSIIRSRSGRQADVYRKDITKIMKDQGLKIEVKSNLKVVDYLDITFNLNDGSYKPFNKPNNNPRYVHVQSSHPPNITKQIPKSISNRISVNSCSEIIFNEAAPYYNNILKNCGYSETISYSGNQINTNENEEQIAPNEGEGNNNGNETVPEQNMNRRRNRNRNVIWFNPPYCKSVETKVGRVFLRLVDKHFGNNHKYHKIFNRNTVKVSYSCMDSMENVIKQHNKKVMGEEKPIQRPCNCPIKENCPLGNKCLYTNVVYSAVVNHTDSSSNKVVSKTYIGLSEPEWKQRYGVHRHTFNYRSTDNDTSLSKYIWNVRDKGYEPSVKWSILGRASGYNKSSKTCGLCLLEKLLICEFPDKENLINDRSELVSKCLHFQKHLLKNCKPNG